MWKFYFYRKHKRTFSLSMVEKNFFFNFSEKKIFFKGVNVNNFLVAGMLKRSLTGYLII